ncbi:hypothetical protein [Mongoliimonas terrestris]|uniref:hypothetical protein n=1 Tax=Mongoliimonas terrestris TaxID=1709001 RepID=UPI0009497DF5|nr:hypothetical protein [Mongoliimonas terrestris]
MSDDLKRLQRLLKVQSQLHDLAERRLRQTDGAAAALAVERRRLVAALNDSSTAHADLILAITATRLGSLDRQIAAADRARSAAAGVARLQAGRKDVLEARHAAASDAAAAAAERLALEAIGLAAALSDASPAGAHRPDATRPGPTPPDGARPDEPSLAGAPEPVSPAGDVLPAKDPAAVAGRGPADPRAGGQPRARRRS